MSVDSSYSDLLALLACDSKRTAKCAADAMTLTSSALDDLIVNAANLGLVHQICVRDVLPPHLLSGLASLAARAPQRLTARMPQIFVERRHLVGHLFHSKDGSTWHLIYFSQRDMGWVVEANWEGGPHVHYLSHLWPEHSMQSIVHEFRAQKPKLSSGLHIRYLDDDRLGI